jgi:hypothetical protein
LTGIGVVRANCDLILSWVSERGRIITNRSVFVDDESWYEMLFISKGDFEEIDTEIKQSMPEKPSSSCWASWCDQRPRHD